MSEVFTRRLSRWQAEQQRGDIADLYVGAHPGSGGDEDRRREAFLERFDRDTRRPGFDMVAAGGRGTVAAAHGFRLDPADDWWRGVTGGPPPGLEELTAAGRVFALAGLMVLPAFRRQGVAGRLLEQLLLRSEAAVAAALVDPDDDPAAATPDALEALGWQRIGDVRRGPARSPARQVWTRSLTDR